MESEEKRWFAMRATYGRNIMAQRTLDAADIESFIPMRQRQTKRGRRVKIEIIPVVRDLIFVLAEREVLQSHKAKIPYLHYITRPIEGRNTPIEVPTEQMSQFIRLCENGGEVESSTEQIEFRLGERVRITHGSLQGVEGQLIKIQGKRSRRFTIQIEGVCAAMIDIKAEEIEPIHC